MRICVRAETGNAPCSFLPFALAARSHICRCEVQEVVPGIASFQRQAERQFRVEPIFGIEGPHDFIVTRARCAATCKKRTAPTASGTMRGGTAAASRSFGPPPLHDAIVRLLDEIQQALFQRALQFRESHTQRVSSYDEFKSVMEGRPGFVIAGWCGSAECEAQIKAETQATLRNIPFGGADAPGSCVKCGKHSPSEAWFAKAY